MQLRSVPSSRGCLHCFLHCNWPGCSHVHFCCVQDNPHPTSCSGQPQAAWQIHTYLGRQCIEQEQCHQQEVLILNHLQQKCTQVASAAVLQGCSSASTLCQTPKIRQLLLSVMMGQGASDQPTTPLVVVAAQAIAAAQSGPHAALYS